MMTISTLRLSFATSIAGVSVCTLILLIFRLQTQQSHLPVRFHPEIPSFEVKEKVNKWIIIQKFHSSLNKSCRLASQKFPEWNILLIKEQNGAFLCHDTGRLSAVVLPRNMTRQMKVPSLLADLFAIQRNATAIYHLPKYWNDPKWKMTDFVLEYRNSLGLVYKDDEKSKFNMLNFYKHFGCGDKDIGNAGSLYDLNQHPVPAIQVPIAVPDMKNLVCDPSAPPVTVPPNLFADNLLINEAMFTRSAFWALVFPALLRRQHFTSLHNIAGVLVQKVLWSSGDRVKLHRNDVLSELPQDYTNRSYVKIPKVLFAVRILRSVSCERLSVTACLKACLDILVTNSFISPMFAENINNWQNVLADFDMSDSSFSREKKFKNLSQNVWFHPGKFLKHTDEKNTSTSTFPMTNSGLVKQVYNQICNETHNPAINLTHPWTQFSDILLVVVFNRHHFETIPLLEIMYRPFFPHILYCGSYSLEYVMQKDPVGFQFSYVQYSETTPHPGATNYNCAALAVSMAYDVKGYAVMGDDVLFTIPKLNVYSKDVAWYVSKSNQYIVDVARQRSCVFTNGSCSQVNVRQIWGWFDENGVKDATDFMKYDKVESVNFQCLMQLKKLTGAQQPVVISLADFYYIPKHLSKKFAGLVQHFAKHSVFLELTVPTLLNCLEDENNMVRMPIFYESTPQRNHLWMYIERDVITGDTAFIHPTKWGSILLGDVYLKHFYCQKVIPFLHNRNASFLDLKSSKPPVNAVKFETALRHYPGWAGG